VAGTGAEGGISNTILLWGTTMDGNDATFWYSVDWVQINSDLRVSNAVINGSNNPLAPLDYNQDGINVLQQVELGVMSDAITFGLATGTVVMTELSPSDLAVAIEDGAFTGLLDVNAVPFIPYSLANPGDYKIGRYAGLSARGFTAIVININVSQFIAQ
jgi:hypothetical protein